MTFKKQNCSRDSFWELSQQALQEDFWDNERLALDYLNCKFWEDVADEIKDRIAQALSDN